MAVIKINAFGGEIPRVEARGLPLGAAQLNQNLMATSNDFRPLFATGVSVKSTDQGIKSLYRFQRKQDGSAETSMEIVWEATTKDLNFCRGQVNDDQTERTYISDNTGVTMPYVQTNKYPATPRYLLGVPAPTVAPSVSLLSTTKFTKKKATEWVTSTLIPKLRDATLASLLEDQFFSRFRIEDPRSSYNEVLSSGLGRSIAGLPALDLNQNASGWYEYFPARRWISTGVEDISQRGVYEPWNLVMRVPGWQVTKEGFGNPQLGSTILTDARALDPSDTINGTTYYPWFAPVPCLPFWGEFAPLRIEIGDKLAGVMTPSKIEDKLGFKARAKLILNPITNLQLMTNSQIEKVSKKLIAYFAPPAKTDKRRAAIATHVRNMEIAMYMMTKRLRPVKGQSAAAVLGIPAITVPTTETDDAYAKRVAEWEAAQAAAVATWVAESAKCDVFSHEIENEYFTKKAELDVALKTILQDIPLEKNSDQPQGLLYIDDDSIVETRFYLTTFVSSVGEESAPSPPSRMLTLNPNDLVAIKRPDIPGPVSSDGANGLIYDVTKWRIYRSNAGTDTTAFQFVAELGINDVWSKAPYQNGWGATGLAAIGYGDEKKWRDIIGNYVVYNQTGRIPELTWSTVGFEKYVNPKDLYIGDTVTQIDQMVEAVKNTTSLTTPSGATITIDQIMANDYAITKTWNGHSWTTGQVAPIASDGVTIITGSKTYVDGLSSTQLGEVLPTTTWALPPYRMTVTDPEVLPFAVKGSDPFLRGLVVMPNGIMAGFIDNFVAFSDPYHPYAWPVEYQIPLDYPIVGLCAFGQTLVVGTVGNPYFISGSDSMSMSAQKLNDNQACVSARSMVAAMGGVFYASPDGYCFASQNGVEVATTALFSRDDWKLLNPETIFATVHDNVLYFWCSATTGPKCYGMDLVAKKLTRHEISATAVFDDVVQDAAFVAGSGTIRRMMDPTAGKAVGTYKSGKITLPAQVPFAWVKIMSDFSSPVTVNWYGDGVLRKTSTFTNLSPQRLPPGRYLEHELEVISQARVTSVVIAGSTQELQNE